MNSKTNTLQKFIDAFGEDAVIAAINKARSIKSPGSIVKVSNPIMRFVMNTSYVRSGKVYTHGKMAVPQEDYSAFRLASAVLNDIKPELAANESYKSQLFQKLLHPQSGPMLSALNEIIVAAYYKYLGITVKLNSSQQKGLADIDLGELPFASDVKLFSNNRLLLEAIVNTSAEQIAKSVSLIGNQGLLISVFNPNKKLFKKSLLNLAKAFEDTTIGNYSDEVLSANIIHNDYLGADFQVNVQPQNVNVFFQASWDMAPAVEKLKESMETAVKQSKAISESKQAIPWVMVPRDADRNGIELAMLRFYGEFHTFTLEYPDIFAIPVYSLEFKGNQVLTAFDIFQTGENTFNIKAETFQDFVRQLMSRPEIYT